MFFSMYLVLVCLCVLKSKSLGFRHGMQIPSQEGHQKLSKWGPGTKTLYVLSLLSVLIKSSNLNYQEYGRELESESQNKNNPPQISNSQNLYYKVLVLNLSNVYFTHESLNYSCFSLCVHSKKHKTPRMV